MKNKKKFKKELCKLLVNGDNLAVDPNGNPVPCNTIDCSDCKLCFVTCCQERRKKWLEAEYVEQEVDWSKVPIDTKVLVKDFNNKQTSLSLYLFLNAVINASTPSIFGSANGSPPNIDKPLICGLLAKSNTCCIVSLVKSLPVLKSQATLLKHPLQCIGHPCTNMETLIPGPLLISIVLIELYFIVIV